MRTPVGLLAAILLLAGCGTGTASVADDPGPADRAVRQLECAGRPTHHGAGDYGDGLTEVQDGPRAALGNWLDAEAWFSALPRNGYVVEWQRDGRALLSFDVAGRTRIAVVVADDVRDYRDATGWGVETWAQCDPSEWPAATTDRLGIGVWTDRSGHRQPTGRIVSFPGAEHCDWQDVIFLRLGSERDGVEYLRDVSGELADFESTTYDASSLLPRSATDTGWRRDGRELWLGAHPRTAYLVSLDDPQDVQRWPAATQHLGCE